MSEEEMEVRRGTNRKVQSSHDEHEEAAPPPLPEYLSDHAVSVPELPSDAWETKWEMVEPDLGLHASGNRTTATRVVESLRNLHEDERKSLNDELATIEGSRELLMRLESCIQNESFQSRIWRKLQGIEETEMKAMDTSKSESQVDVTDGSFVFVTHQDVVDALAEHLVMTYIENYHQEDIKQWKSGNKYFRRFLGVLNSIMSTVGIVARSPYTRSLWDVGVAAASSSIGVISLASVYPQAAVTILGILWQVCKFAFTFSL
jgi:hypothetical protein